MSRRSAITRGGFRDLGLCAKLVFTVVSDVDEEREDWGRLALQNLERAYGPDEPDYPPDLIKEANPEYEPG